MYFSEENSIVLQMMSEDEDSLRFYNLGDHPQTRIEQFGKKQSYDAERDYLSV